MKKYVILSMTLLFLLSFAACGDKTTGENDTTTEKAVAQTSETTTVYDDGFGELIDGEEVPSQETAQNTEKSTSETPTTPTAQQSSVTSTEANSSVSSNESETLTVEDFSGGDSDDFGQLF